jgi:hypothetical protein
MDICDAIEDADDHDVALPPKVQAVVDQVNDLAVAAELLQQDFKYPVDHDGNIMFLNFLHPDLAPVLVTHLVRCGWRKDFNKRLIKQRPVVGSAFTDLVTYVPLDQPDGPIHVERPQPEQVWSVKPTVNMIDEERAE